MQQIPSIHLILLKNITINDIHTSTIKQVEAEINIENQTPTNEINESEEDTLYPPNHPHPPNYQLS